MEAASSSSSKTRNTVYVSNIPNNADVQQILDAFVTFGDILDVKLPKGPEEKKGHRGFAFLTFSNPEDAADAIDNFDLNELPGFVGQGKFLKCSVANPDKFGSDGRSDKRDRPIWETEEWLQEHGQKDAPDANGTTEE